jgi:hypothetical protein
MYDRKSSWSRLVCRHAARDSHAVPEEPLLRTLAVPHARIKKVSGVRESSAAKHPQAGRGGRFAPVRSIVRIRQVEAGAPFPDIALHVEQAQFGGLLAADGEGREGLRRSIEPRHVSESLRGKRLAAPRGEFPFCFRRQPEPTSGDPLIQLSDK